MTKSPAIYSRQPEHLLAWHIMGEAEPTPPVDSAAHFAVQSMARGAMRALVAGVTAPYGLVVGYTGGSGFEYIETDGRVRSLQQITLLGRGHTDNTDHTTAEMRASLATGWDVAQSYFMNTASAYMDAEQAERAIGGLVIPRPDDIAMPDRTLYLPNTATDKAA